MFFILALFAFFAIALPDAMLGVAWPFMRVTFDQPIAAVTLLLPFGVAASLLSTSCWTWAAAHLGLGRLLTASVAMSAAALICCAVAPSFGVIVGCAVLFGLSGGAIDAALNAYAAHHFGPRQIGLMHAAYGLGAATSPLVVTAVVSLGASWRWAYCSVALIQGCLTLLFLTSAHRWNKSTSAIRATTKATTVISPRPTWWRTRPTFKAALGLALAAVGSGLEAVLGLWAFTFLLDAVDMTAKLAGLVVSGYWIALVVSRVLLGSLAERIGIWPFLAGTTVTAIGAAALLLTNGPTTTSVAIIVLGFAVAPLSPLLMLTTGERTAVASVDRLVGFQAAATTLGSVLLAGFVGLLMGHDLSAFTYCVLALALLTSIGVWTVRPGHPNSPGNSAD